MNITNYETQNKFKKKLFMCYLSTPLNWKNTSTNDTRHYMQLICSSVRYVPGDRRTGTPNYILYRYYILF